MPSERRPTSLFQTKNPGANRSVRLHPVVSSRVSSSTQPSGSIINANMSCSPQYKPVERSCGRSGRSPSPTTASAPA